MAQAQEIKKEVVSAITLALVAILSAGLTIFWNVFLLFLPAIAVCTQNVSVLITTPGVYLMGSPFLVLLITMALMRFHPMRRHLTRTSLVYLYVTSISAAYFVNTSYPWEYTAGLPYTKLFTSENLLQYIPDFIAYPRDLANLMWQGVGNLGAIPWAALFPNFIWNFLMIALFGGISISIASIFRRQWIDVERIPFPQVMLAHSALVNVESSMKPEWASKKPFLIGMLVGFLLQIPVSAVTLFPWFPDILAWRTNTCGPGSQHIAPPDIPWNLGIMKNPTMYALSLLVPLHFLFSVLFYLLVLEVALFASYALGYFTGITGEGFCGRNWCTPTPYSDPPLYFGVINTGAILGFFVITLFLQRGYLLDTLMTAFRGSSVRADKEAEPMSYRNSWILLIMSCTLMMVFLFYTGLGPWLSFAIMSSSIISWFVMVSVWGRAGVDWDSPCSSIAPGFVKLLVYPTIGGSPEITSTELAVGPVITTGLMGYLVVGGCGGSLYATLASYKMANLTGIKSKNVLKVMSVAMFVSMFVTLLAQRALLGVYGAFKFPPPTIRTSPIESDRWNLFWSTPTALSTTQVAPWLVIGFLFMVVMRLMYSRILWLPDPLAAITAWSWTVSLHGIWFPFLVAWVIKYLVLKVGGSKLYEQRVVPFVGGFMLGDVLEIFIAALTAYGLVRFV